MLKLIQYRIIVHVPFFTNGGCSSDFLINNYRRVNVQTVIFNNLFHRLADKAVRAFYLLIIAANVL
ncbi:hypothetical protein AEU84_24415 [Salmonella enterica subsp. enterica serovar Typhimurium var. 5-]|nr:hypothetical protein AEU84_24415 [Salmonella enterica subsp. enterica serovar Typhimurium var. 5-]